jgi:hypothetical protein
MSSHSETCRAHALHCREIAERTCTAEDRSEFLIFAQSWDKLAVEIDQNDRLVGFIEKLTATLDKNAEWECDEQSGRSDTQSLRRLTAIIVSISDLVTSEATHHLNLLRR